MIKSGRLILVLTVEILTAGLVGSAPRAFAAATDDSAVQASTTSAQSRQEAKRRIADRRGQLHDRIKARRAARSRRYGVGALRRLRVPPPARLRLNMMRGGLVRRADRVAVSVPPAAMPQDLDISIAQPAPELAREDAAAGKGLRPASLPVAFGPEGTVFNAPVTITVPYDPVSLQEAGLREADLKVHYWNPRLNAWESLPSRVDVAARTVSAEVMHFSVYQVLGTGNGIGVAAVDDAGFRAAYAFPNPSHNGATITFRFQPGLADTVSLRIYDLSGRKIHDAGGFRYRGLFDDGNGLGAQHSYEFPWDVSGVGSGVYTFHLEAQRAGQDKIRKSGKVAVVK